MVLDASFLKLETRIDEAFHGTLFAGAGVGRLGFLQQPIGPFENLVQVLPGHLLSGAYWRDSSEKQQRDEEKKLSRTA